MEEQALAELALGGRGRLFYGAGATAGRASRLTAMAGPTASFAGEQAEKPGDTYAWGTPVKNQTVTTSGTRPGPRAATTGQRRVAGGQRCKRAQLQSACGNDRTASNLSNVEHGQRVGRLLRVGRR